MVNGDWVIKMVGRGKIYPHDADEIEELYVTFIQTLQAAGHTMKGLSLRKAKDPDPLDE